MYEHFTCAQDWVPYFRKLFSFRRVSRLLEFGMGHGTQFLLDNCDHVVSMETAARDYHHAWHAKCLEMYKDYKNWTPLIWECGEKLKAANTIGESGGYPIQDLSYLEEIKSMTSHALTFGPFDVALVDAGIHNRGDIINQLFGSVDVIGNHDNTISGRHYGWDIIAMPADYEKVVPALGGLGTAFWIKKSKLDLIAFMR